MPSRPHQRLCTRPGPWVRGSAGAAASGNAELARVPVGSMHKAVPGTPGSLLPRLVPELENRNRAAGSDGLAVEETQALLAPLFSPLWAGSEMSVFIQGRSRTLVAPNELSLQIAHGSVARGRNMWQHSALVSAFSS